MSISGIENRQDVRDAARVLSLLEARGLREASIAAGWTRSLLTGGETADIDVSYVGAIHYEEARVVLSRVLDEVNPANKSMWDVEGIWNAQLAYGVGSVVDNFLIYYLNSIDSVYLAADGKLHDPTGHGFEDARTKTLRINEYDLIDRTPTASEEVNVCLENCRRLAKFQWHPTSRTVERLKAGPMKWNELNGDEQNYFISKLGRKYSTKQRSAAKQVYDSYGWGFIFDL